MFKHLLLPTDGSPLSEKGVRVGVALARALGARVMGLYVSPRFQVLTYRPNMLEEARDTYERDAKTHADRYLAFISMAAADGKVPCETLSEIRDDVHQSIIDVARARGCDLIVMASHGRHGIAGMLLGSETQRVLTHSNIPVLVCR
jgi:nucleotide-binding universal stress UspA family protein